MTEPRDERQVRSLRELPQAIEPQRDLWPGIEARLNPLPAAAPLATDAQRLPVRGGSARLRWLAAAAMVASVAVGVWIGRSMLPAGGPGGAATSPTNPPGFAALSGGSALDATYVSDPRYQHQR